MAETFEVTNEFTVTLARFPDGWWKMRVKDTFTGESTETPVSQEQMQAFAKWLLTQVALAEPPDAR